MRTRAHLVPFLIARREIWPALPVRLNSASDCERVSGPESEEVVICDIPPGVLGGCIPGERSPRCEVLIPLWAGEGGEGTSIAESGARLDGRAMERWGWRCGWLHWWPEAEAE